MAENHTPIPRRDKVTEGGILSDVWRRFFESIFADAFKRIKSLEEASEDHESRIETLENP